jgi:GTP pyrophosphokinase
MLPNLTRPASRPATGGSTDLPITGLVPGVPISFAGCCHPLQGDRIVGIITTGKGVNIHTADCPTLESFASQPERFTDVDWETGAAAARGKVAPERGGVGHTGRISVIADNEPGALAAISNAVSKHDGSLSNLRTINRQADFFEVLVDVEVRDLRHLSTVIAGLRAAHGIRQVERARG